MSVAPYVFPEDHGAAADGATDDWNAIQEAIGATGPGQATFFSGNYAISQPLAPGVAEIACSSAATLSAIGGNLTAFSGLAGNGRHRIPKMTGFAGPAVVLSTGVMDIACQQISDCSAGFKLTSGAINNTIRVQWFASVVDCLVVTTGSQSGVVQGNKVFANFAAGCTHGLNFDGSPNCDSNSLEFGSWDSTGPTGQVISGATVFLNTGATPLSTWRLFVTEWLGGILAAPAGYIIRGAFQFCRVKTALFDTASDNWGAVAVTVGGGMSYECSSSTGYSNSFVANWQAAPNSRMGFGAAYYANTRRCNGKCAPMPTGALVTYYVYSPFVDGNSYGFRAMPVVNPGFELVSIADNSAVNHNEVAITWRAVNAISQKAPAEYDEFDFQFTSGIP